MAYGACGSAAYGQWPFEPVPALVEFQRLAASHATRRAVTPSISDT
jgi:hypothetical protein